MAVGDTFDVTDNLNGTPGRGWGGVFSADNDGGTFYNGAPISQLSTEQLANAMAGMEANGPETMGNKLPGRGKWNGAYATISSMYQVKSATDAYNEMLSGMAESFAAMAEASSRVEPASEPLKQAQDVYSSSRSEVAKRQQLRSGLLSSFNRWGYGGSTKLDGKANTLG